jgi:hypothetical protein
MQTETIIKVSLIVLFLLYAYFMIGEYAPCTTNNQYYDYFNNCQYPYQPYSIVPLERDGVPTIYPNTFPEVFNSGNKNIYQMGPYMNF